VRRELISHSNPSRKMAAARVLEIMTIPVNLATKPYRSSWREEKREQIMKHVPSHECSCKHHDLDIHLCNGQSVSSYTWELEHLPSQWRRAAQDSSATLSSFSVRSPLAPTRETPMLVMPSSSSIRRPCLIGTYDSFYHHTTKVLFWILVEAPNLQLWSFKTRVKSWRWTECPSALMVLQHLSRASASDTLAPSKNSFGRDKSKG